MIFGNLSATQATAVAIPGTKQPLHLVRVGNGMRAVVVHGSEFISDKLMALVGTVLDLDENGAVSSITFRNDGYPEGSNAICDHNTGAIAINLERLFEQVAVVSQEKSCALSISGLWNLFVLAAVAHELWHLDRCKQDGRVKYFEIPEEQREDKADDHAEWALIHIAQRFNIEPAMLKDEPFLGVKMTSLFIANAENPWIIHQRRLIEQGLMYQDAAGVQLKTLRQYVRGWDPNRDHPDWKQDTFDVVITYHKGADGKETVVAPAPAQPMPTVPVMPMAAAAPNVGAITLPADAVEPERQILVDDLGAEGMIYSADEAGEEITYYSAEDDGVPQDYTPPMAAPAPAAAPAPYQAATQQVQPHQPRMYPPNAYTNEQLVEYAARLYAFLDNYIFNKCGWLGNGFFANPNAILEPVDISNVVPQDFVMECEGLDANGRWNPHLPGGRFIKGQVFKNAGVPGYTLHLNARGTGLKRLIMAQNPNKPSRSAADAKAGNRITWVIKDDGGDKWHGSFTNGVFKPSGTK